MTQPASSRVMAVVVALTLTAALIAMARWYERGEIGWRHSVALAVVVPAGVLFGLSTVTGGRYLTLSSWPEDLTSLSIVLAAFEARGRYLWAPLLTYVAACMWWSQRFPGFTPGIALGACASPLVAVGFAVGVRRLVARGARQIDAQQRAVAAHQLEAARAEAAIEARRRLLEELDEDVFRVLSDVAAGAVIDGETVARARTLREQLRDVLYLGAVPPAPLREVIAGARGRGIRVAVRASERPADRDALTGIEAMLGHVLAVAEPASIVVYADPPRLAVVPPLEPAAIDAVARSGAVVAHEPGRTGLLWATSSDRRTAAAVGAADGIVR